MPVMVVRVPIEVVRVGIALSPKLVGGFDAIKSLHDIIRMALEH
jgi:hypothetical protein